MKALREGLRRRVFALRAGRAGAHRLGALGPDSVIVPPVTIRLPHRIQIGSGVLVSERVSFFLVDEHHGRRYEPRIRIGDRCIVGHGVWFSCVGEIDIGNDVLIGHDVLVSDSFHEYADLSRPVMTQPMAPPQRVSVGPGAIIGPGAAILSGTSVGPGAYVAAGAVVAGEIPPHSVVAGNPGKVIRRWDPEQEAWIDDPDPSFAEILRSLSR